ncbi:MFS transporter [Gryllotalpicola protaetiae]|uniref:MFS transporter n=2 Tax=Gryllotalpicola protaetiae TaxID=2419771 RepID=A0A387BNR3_9MICO|nr:MFS transporter [Gryllotalpicola protaetiae]
MTTLDFFIVNVAVPSMQEGLGASSAQIEWVLAGFGLAYGVGLITGGRLGDLYGRKSMFLLGLGLFTVASLLCGVAASAGMLIAARVVQGLASALLAPQVLAILGTLYTGAARARVFTGYGLAMGLAAVFGQLIGGALTHADIAGLGWRSCFLVNIPIGALIIVLAQALVPATPRVKARLDPAGILLVAAAITAIVLPLIQGRDAGWPVWAWLSLGAGAALFAVFVWQQRRLAERGGAPLVNVEMFHDRAFVVGLACQLVFWIGQASFFLVLALYLQSGRGLDALGAGVLFTAIGAGYLLTSMTAGRIARRLGRQVIAMGALLMVVGLALLSAAVIVGGDSASVGWLIPGLVVDGAGMGLAVAPLASTVLARMHPEYAGSASGVLSTALQIGNALGVALIGIVFYHGLAGAGYGVAFTHSLVFLLAIAAVLIALTQALPSGRDAR